MTFLIILLLEYKKGRVLVPSAHFQLSFTQKNSKSYTFHYWQAQRIKCVSFCVSMVRASSSADLTACISDRWITERVQTGSKWSWWCKALLICREASISLPKNSQLYNMSSQKDFQHQPKSFQPSLQSSCLCLKGCRFFIKVIMFLKTKQTTCQTDIHLQLVHKSAGTRWQQFPSEMSVIHTTWKGV